jgi:hypothetical protein
MKVAICISGFIRTWEHTKRSFVEQFSNIDADVFIHTYRQNYYEMTAGKQNTILSDNDFDKLFNGINVKSIIIEDRDELLPEIMAGSSKYSHISNYSLPQLESSDSNSQSIPIGARTYDHLRKIHLCNETRKDYEKNNNVEYDLVVKTRFDIVYFNSPDCESCCDGKFHFGYGATWGWPEDTFCITTPALMDQAYANRFLYFDEMFVEESFGICSHGTLKYMIEKYSIEIGNPAVNILCFRSENRVQYGGDYKFRCDLTWLYEIMKSLKLKDVYELEIAKNRIMRF